MPYTTLSVSGPEALQGTPEYSHVDRFVVRVHRGQMVHTCTSESDYALTLQLFRTIEAVEPLLVDIHCEERERVGDGIETHTAHYLNLTPEEVYQDFAVSDFNFGWELRLYRPYVVPLAKQFKTYAEYVAQR